MKTSSLIKLVAGLILVLSIAAVSANNITYGVRIPNDTSCQVETYSTASRSPGKIQALIVFPPTGSNTNSNLTAIEVIDHVAPTNYSSSKLLQGGPGHRYATLLLKSQFREPLNFTINYYGCDLFEPDMY